MIILNKFIVLPDVLVAILFAIVLRTIFLQLNNLVELITYIVAGIVIIVFSSNLGKWRTHKLEEVKEYWKKKWGLEEIMARLMTQSFFMGKWDIWLFRILGAAMSSSAIYRIVT
jgi:hypothetical protein